MARAVNRNDLYSENPELENRKPGEQGSTRMLCSSKAQRVRVGKLPTREVKVIYSQREAWKLCQFFLP